MNYSHTIATIQQYNPTKNNIPRWKCNVNAKLPITTNGTLIKLVFMFYPLEN
jgi:hypothetical protein